LTLLQNHAHTFAVSDFGFSDANDTPANLLHAVKITTLPGAGTLTNDGAVVNAGDLIPVGAISGGKLAFTPAANALASPYASFTFQVQDDGGTSDAASTSIRRPAPSPSQWRTGSSTTRAGSSPAPSRMATCTCAAIAPTARPRRRSATAPGRCSTPTPLTPRSGSPASLRQRANVQL